MNKLHNRTSLLTGLESDVTVRIKRIQTRNFAWSSCKCANDGVNTGRGVRLAEDEVRGVDPISLHETETLIKIGLVGN